VVGFWPEMENAQWSGELVKIGFVKVGGAGSQ
jgi:hypothetical protein